MSQPMVFARARPSAIRLTEEFGYNTWISRNPRTERQGTPLGRLQVVMPYDGYEYFGRTAIDDVQRQWPGFGSGEPLEARIGYLALDNASHTDLEDRLNLSLHHNVVPLDVPIQGQGLLGTEGLCDDRHACHITYDYRPDWPETTPLTIQASIFDEEVIQEVWEGEAEQLKTAAERVAAKMGQPAPWSPGLYFSFDLGMVLPGRVGRDSDPEPPTLASMALEWPVATSHRLVHLSLADHDAELPVVYNPERGVIEWGNIPFWPLRRQEGTDLFTYRAPTILLRVDRPGELYRRETLHAQIRVEIPRLFSDVRPIYFAADGREGKAPLETRCAFTADITIRLEDRFDRKVFSPYQHLQFEGVILDEMRIADIVTLLKDQGFRAESWELRAPRQAMKHFLVYGSRQEGPEKLELWMLVEGTYSRATRTKVIAGGETYESQIDTGKTTLYMRGQLRGEGPRLVGVMNDIQAALKERFFHVSTME